jgi:hypothetical protein
MDHVVHVRIIFREPSINSLLKVFESTSYKSVDSKHVNHGIRNPEANVRYAFENQQRTTGNPSDIFSRNMTILR